MQIKDENVTVFFKSCKFKKGSISLKFENLL